MTTSDGLETYRYMKYLEPSVEEIDIYAELYMNIYNSLHPDNPLMKKPSTEILNPNEYTLDKKKFEYYCGIIGLRNVLNRGYAAYSRKVETELPAEFFADLSDNVWLFYNFPVENFEEKLAHFIIMLSDENEDEVDGDYLYLEDYVLLFYASLQEGDLKATLEVMPLTMLHDMYDSSVAYANVKAWIEE
jgi:hypothetical protein